MKTRPAKRKALASKPTRVPVIGDKGNNAVVVGATAEAAADPVSPSVTDKWKAIRKELKCETAIVSGTEHDVYRHVACPGSVSVDDDNDDSDDDRDGPTPSAKKLKANETSKESERYGDDDARHFSDYDDDDKDGPKQASKDDSADIDKDASSSDDDDEDRADAVEAPPSRRKQRKNASRGSKKTTNHRRRTVVYVTIGGQAREVKGPGSGGGGGGAGSAPLAASVAHERDYRRELKKLRAQIAKMKRKRRGVRVK